MGKNLILYILLFIGLSVFGLGITLMLLELIEAYPTLTSEGIDL